MAVLKIFAILFAVIAASYSIIRSSSKTLYAPDPAIFSVDATVAYPATYYPGAGDVDLPFGRTHYYIFGPSGGRRIVFVHGFAVPSPVWTEIANQAVSQGYQVLLYDLYGRGYSDAPATRYTDAFYVTQLAMLLYKLGWDHEPFALAGVSMGGAIVTLFTEYFGDMVSELILVCPAGLMSSGDIPRINQAISKLPDSIITLILKPILKVVILSHTKPAAYSENARQLVERIQAIVQFQVEHHTGYFRALSLSLSHFPFVGLEDVFESVGRNSQRPVLVVWGDADSTVPFKHSNTLMKKIPHAKLVVVPGGEHDITLTNGDIVAGAILEFLDKDKMNLGNFIIQ